MSKNVLAFSCELAPRVAKNVFVTSYIVATFDVLACSALPHPSCTIEGGEICQNSKVATTYEMTNAFFATLGADLTGKCE